VTSPSMTSAPEDAGPRAWRSLAADALGHRFEVVAEVCGPDLTERLEAVLAPLATQRKPSVTYTITPTARERYRLVLDGDVLCDAGAPGPTVRHLVWHVNQCAVRAARSRHTVLHAAAAHRTGCTVVLPAPMGSGKTTTVAGLLVKGWDYVSDEAVALRRDDLRILSFPKALSLDPGSWPLFPEARPRWLDSDLDGQWQVSAGTLGARHAAAPGSPRLVIMPRFTGRRTRLHQVAPAEAVVLLARSTFGFPAGGEEDLDVLVRLVEGCPVYSLEIADLAGAVELIEKTVGGLP
jgi:hypothetical protein